MPPLCVILQLSAFCRLPVVHPSVHHRFTLFVSPLTIVSGRPAGGQAGRQAHFVAKVKNALFQTSVKGVGQVGMKAGTFF
jgi:hypothetical protein